MTPNTVYLMLGHRAAIEHPGDLGAANAALRAAVAKRGKKWNRVAPLFGLLPAGAREVVVGVMLQKAPLVLDAPSRTFPTGPLARRHGVVPARLETESVDDHSVAIEALTPACEAIETELAKLGVRVPRSVPEVLLVSPTGATGIVVAGGLSEDATTALEAWSLDDEEGRRVRVVGVPLARVDAETPVAALPPTRTWSDRDALGQRARRAIAEAGIRAEAGLWLLGFGHVPAVADRPRPTVGTTFRARAFAEVREAFAATRRESPTEQRVGTTAAIAFGDLSRWPGDSVSDALALASRPVTDAQAFAHGFPLRETIGAYGAPARGRMSVTDDWAVLDVTIVPREGPELAALLAVFRVQDGWAALSTARVEVLAAALGVDVFASSAIPWRPATLTW